MKDIQNLKKIDVDKWFFLMIFHTSAPVFPALAYPIVSLFIFFHQDKLVSTIECLSLQFLNQFILS